MADQTESVQAMDCAQLADMLKQIITDEKFQPDLQKLIDKNIDGDLLLGLFEDKDLLDDLKLTADGKAVIRLIINKVKDGSFELPEDGGQKLLEPDMPLYTTETPTDTSPAAVNASTDGGMQGSWIPANAVWSWKDRKEIYVEFRNVDLLRDWTIDNGLPMNTDTILHYANTWSRKGDGKIPSFVEVEQGGQAHIRVGFNNDKLCNSHLGKRAQQVPISQPTMNLDLHNGCPDDQYKKHLIIHMFGHALGLGHEHQRSNFWTCIRPFVNVKKMKKDMSEERFSIDWEEIPSSELGPHGPEYDPDSIMHYWFKVEWLNNGYDDKTKVERDRDRGILSKMQAKALLGLHKRRQTLASEPSKGEIALLKQVYSVLTEPELQVVSRLLAAYSNEKIKEIQQAIQMRRGRDVSIQEVERSLREVGMMTIADELEQNLQKGVENAAHYQAYQAALKGAITLPLRYMKFLFFGCPRSGKSTMRQRLLQQIINLAILGQPSVSTGVAEACEVIIKKMTSETAAIAGSHWHSLKNSIERGALKENVVAGTDIDLKYLAQILYHLIFKTMTSTSSPSLTSEAIPQPADSETSNGGDDPTPHDDNDVSITGEPSPPPKKAKYEEASVEVTTDRSRDSEMAEIAKAFDELANILQSDSPEEFYHLLKALTLINMSDVGGQPEFLDVVPALTVGAALYLLFFRLDQEIHKRYPVKYLAPGSTTEKTLTSSYCIEEVLHQALASIACFSGHSSEESAYSAPSRAILVGTYKDQVTASDIEEKEKKIQEKFTSAKVYEDLLLTTKEGKPFFTVDNMNGTDESEMSDIRSNIENIVKTLFKEVPIPASWLMFRVMLHLLNKPIVSLSQCEEIARRLLMPTPVQEALWFFHHHVGSLLYYPDIPSMRGTVICTPQVIFDSISTVIIGNFQYSNYQVPRKAVEQFQQTGLFSLSDINEKTEEHRSSHLSSHQLVDVLKHQGILAEVKHDEEESSSEPAESKVIIPAVLEHASDEELKPSPSLEASPLMIRFKGGFVPFGLFSASVARLIAHADSMSLKWKLREEVVRKNKVKFLVAGAYNVTLISRPRYLEIQLERYSRRARCKRSLADICSAVRQTVVETLETTISTMQYRPQACVASVLLSSQRPFHLAFSCCMSEPEPHSGHLMKVDKDEDGHYGECLRDGAEVDLDKEHLYWFDKKQPEVEVASQSEATATCKSNFASNTSGYDNEVTNSDLGRMEWTENGEVKVVRIYDNSAHGWHQIGENLGIEDGVLTSIGRDGHDDRERVVTVLGKWYDNARNLKYPDKYPMSWKGLVTLLENSNLTTLAGKVHKALMQRSSRSGSTSFDGETPAAKRQKLTSVQKPLKANDRLKIGDLNDVKKRLWDVRTHWKSIGDALGIDNETLTSIQRKENDDGDRLREMLTIWLRKASTRKRPITWSALVSALKEVEGCGDLAQEIEDTIE